MVKYSREWREKYPEKVEEMEKQWIKNIIEHPEAIVIYHKAIREANKIYENRNNKYKNDLRYNINCRVSSLVWYSLRENKNSNSWVNIVGYNIEDLIKRLKGTMPTNYDWQDFLDGKLHIDHIIPRSVFNFTEAKHIDFKRCWDLSNLRLLPAGENIAKSNKLDKPFQPCLKLSI